MHLAVIGCNHKIADLSLREKLAKAFATHFSRSNPFHRASFVLLSTCNRSELYFSSDTLSETHQEILQILKLHINESFFEQKLYTFFGLDCFIHLAKVCAGLDSAIVAETEIQGQVRLAYRNAHAKGSLNKDLHFLFQKSLKISKECRTIYQEAKKLPDISHALLHYALTHFGAKVPPPLFIGASEINVKIAKFFKIQGITNITLCNRSDTCSSFVEKELGATFLPWSALHKKWHAFDWVICATKCPEYVLEHSGHARDMPKLLVDLSVPRNIDPKLQNETTKLLNIDDLEKLLDARKKALEEQVTKARNTIAHKALQAIIHFQTKTLHYLDSVETG